MPFSLSPDQQWARQWAEAAVPLADVRARDLRAMSDDDALRITDELLGMANPSDVPPAPRTWSGLVELQRLLHAPRRR